MTPRVLCLLVGAALTEASCFVGIDDVEDRPGPADAGGSGGAQGGAAGAGASGGSSGSSGSSGGSGGGGGSSGASGDASVEDGAAGEAGEAEAGPVERVSDGLVALYDFEAGSGDVVEDVSGVGTPIDLTIDTPASVTWIAGALRVTGSVVISSTASTTKILSACQSSNELTVEAWVKPGNLTQVGPARIVSLSIDTENRNFTLGQVAADYRARLRTSTTTPQGSPEMNIGGPVTTTLQHVVMTFDETEYINAYVDGSLQATLQRPGDFSAWVAGYPLLLANEATGDRQWRGDFHLVAIYCRGLSAAEVAQNFAAGAD